MTVKSLARSFEKPDEWFKRRVSSLVRIIVLDDPGNVFFLRTGEDRVPPRLVVQSAPETRCPAPPHPASRRRCPRPPRAMFSPCRPRPASVLQSKCIASCVRQLIALEL